MELASLSSHSCLPAVEQLEISHNHIGVCPASSLLENLDDQAEVDSAPDQKHQV